MLIDLTDVLSEQHKTIDTQTTLEMNEYQKGSDTFLIKEKNPIHLVIDFVQDSKIKIKGETKLTIIIPCDRCLEEVDVPFVLDFYKEVDLSGENEKEDEELDENNFISGHELDVEQLIFNEILVAWPMKTLCREDCEGIIYEKDEALDPRMAAAMDIFKKFQNDN